MQRVFKSKSCLSIHDLEAATEADERLRDQLILEVLVSHMAIVLRVLSNNLQTLYLPGNGPQTVSE
jgi:hypothetical protein